MTVYNFPLSTMPVPYEIVWCRFPFAPQLGEPGPYPRPALVRSTAIGVDNVGEVEVVYGTTTLKLDKRFYDLIVSKMSEMDACGLYRATRFDLDQTVWLPWNTDWFEVRSGFFSPVIGKLTDSMIRWLEVSMSYKKRAQLAATKEPKLDFDKD